ncbi:lipid transferase CIDEB isoform 2-T2 [Menidia menidia]
MSVKENSQICAGSGQSRTKTLLASHCLKIAHKNKAVRTEKEEAEIMDTTSSFLKSVTKRVWSPPQRPFRVCDDTRETKKGITAGTLEELKQRVCQALLLSLSVVSLVCEEDGTEVDSDDFLMTLPDNTMLMALEPGQMWKPLPGTVVLKNHDKPRTGKDIARVTFDLYRLSPMDVFGSLSVKATFQGLYSVSADFQCLGPKKILRETLRLASTLLQAAGHLLISSASVLRRIIEGAELWQPQRAEYTTSWH